MKRSKMVYDPLTKLQCCPTSDGAGCAILASEDFVKKHGLEKTAVEIAGMGMTTDFPSTFEEKSCIKIVGYDMTKKAAEKAYAESGLGPENVDVIELHDCFSCNELITYEGLGLCPPGKGGELIDSGAVDYGGKWVVNPSGGLISKGHPSARLASRNARSSTGSSAASPKNAKSPAPKSRRIRQPKVLWTLQHRRGA